MSEENGKYEFVSNGGCTRCDAMNGRLSDAPSDSPHPGCNCQIVWRDFGAFDPDEACDEEKLRYELVEIRPKHHIMGGPWSMDDEFDLVHTFRIHCPDGEEIETDVVVSTTYGDMDEDQDAMFEDALAEALELAEEIAASECRTCPDPPLVA